MKQCNFVVTERNGVQVFVSRKSGKVLTGAAKRACEEALRRQEAQQEAQQAVQAQAWKIAEEDEAYIAHIEAECDLITGLEMSAEEHRVMFNMTPAQRYIALYLSFAQSTAFRKYWFGEFDPIERRAKEEEARRAEEAEYVKHLEDIADLITGQETIRPITYADIVNMSINDKHQEGIAITGWAFNKPMLDRLMRATWDDALITELTTNHREMHITTSFIAQGLRAMGWKYNRDRKGGFIKAAQRFLMRRTYDFDAKACVQEGRKILPGQFDPQSVREAMKAVIRCIKWAIARNEHDVIANNKTRPVLAMLCIKLLKAITTKR